MSAINLYTSKSAALYFRDSQINKFYEFGGIQLLPNNTYTQKSTGVELGNVYSVAAYSVDDDSYLGMVAITNVEEEINGNEYYANSTAIYVNSTTILTDTNATSELYWSFSS